MPSQPHNKLRALSFSLVLGLGIAPLSQPLVEEHAHAQLEGLSGLGLSLGTTLTTAGVTGLVIWLIIEAADDEDDYYDDYEDGYDDDYYDERDSRPPKKRRRGNRAEAAPQKPSTFAQIAPQFLKQNETRMAQTLVGAPSSFTSDLAMGFGLDESEKSLLVASLRPQSLRMLSNLRQGAKGEVPAARLLFQDLRKAIDSHPTLRSKFEQARARSSFPGTMTLPPK